jgi:cob(I)alamin adenosyltransferase
VKTSGLAHQERNIVVRINKVYTRQGDGGKTRLVGNKKVPKTHLRVEAYGAIDELNSLVGIARTFNMQDGNSEEAGLIDAVLRQMQQRLFDLGSELATDPDYKKKNQVPDAISKDHVEWLEEVIDAFNEGLDPLTSFVLPGGGPLNAFLHQCRTVCRRAERDILRLHKEEAVSDAILSFVNRLSDTFFVISRWVSKVKGEEELLWDEFAPRK